MVDLGAVSSALRVSQDAPYRLAASLIGLPSLVGSFLGIRPIGLMEEVLRWAGVASAQLGGFASVALWATARGPVLVPVCGLIALAAVGLIGIRNTRAGATAVLATAVCSQAGGPQAFLFYLAVAGLWLVLAVLHEVLQRAGKLPLEHYGLQPRPALWLTGLLGATFYIPLVFVRWAFGDDRGAVFR